eukprot:TRINITY_DN13704_c0_g2_i6.p2 TRINITY_DN13704_c0_g2~~TRINITY_DN13704_c0_g2_i6.p2  ORF type:complete len:139 (+),score=16.01 TRINITY_DN13704_c0_g2_i6:74-490(+)
MIRRPPRSTLSSSSAASDVYKRQLQYKTLLCIDCNAWTPRCGKRCIGPSSVEQLRRTLDATHPDELRHDGVVLGDGALLDELEAFQLGSFVSVFDHGAGAQARGCHQASLLGRAMHRLPQRGKQRESISAQERTDRTA